MIQNLIPILTVIIFLLLAMIVFSIYAFAVFIKKFDNIEETVANLKIQIDNQSKDIENQTLDIKSIMTINTIFKDGILKIGDTILLLNKNIDIIKYIIKDHNSDNETNDKETDDEEEESLIDLLKNDKLEFVETEHKSHNCINCYIKDICFGEDLAKLNYNDVAIIKANHKDCSSKAGYYKLKK